MNMTRLVKQTYLLAIFSLFFTHTSTDLHACKIPIKKIVSIEKVTDIFKNPAPDALYIFDIDDTILEPVDLSSQTRFKKNIPLIKIKNSLYNFLNKKKISDQFSFWEQIRLKSKNQKIEQALIDNIISLQKKMIKTIALTSRYTGLIHTVYKEQATYNELLTLNIDFNTSFQQQNIPLDYSPGSLFYKGTIFTNGIPNPQENPKGPTLKAFLKKIKELENFEPKSIYVFDDDLNNVSSVVTSMEELGIECHGFYYTAATSKKRNKNEIDFNVAQIQYQLMMDSCNYVSYKEAQEIHDQIHELIGETIQSVQEKNN
ncbi:MAG: DUF2608 domain-containing protein [bacterium]